jgi:transposase
VRDKDIERVELKEEELRRDLERVKEALGEEVYRRFKYIVETLLFLTRLLERKRTTIKRLRKFLFGSKSEKTKRVLPGDQKESSEESADGKENADGGDKGDGNSENKKKKKRKGHGRNGADKYIGAETVEIPHESLKPGDDCPTENCKGKVYRMAEPKVLVRIEGKPPLSGKVYKLERLRCNLCLTIYTATAPEGVGDKKYDETAVSMMALLRYGTGVPLSRLEELQGSLGIPLPASTQWDVVHKASDIFVPAYEELIREAAQGEVLHNDDTTMKILEMMKEDQERRNLGDPPDRTGMFTTGIVSVRGGVRIALFFTGREHAGENLSKVLAERAEALGRPIQMCDALSRNVSGEFATIVCNCMSHARRPYVEVVENFPAECRFVLETLAEVFKNDATAREHRMSPEERLEFHRKESMRLMATLRLWMWRQLRDRRVEPNSGLGEAIAYMRKHWRKLTRFLFVAGAPLENNLCERVLKKAIRHRRNSLFYKTQNGARVGDLYMSLIVTSQLAGVNSFDYLTELQRRASNLREKPQDWMPWNYRETLGQLSPGDTATL